MPQINKHQERSFTIERSSINQDDRTVELSFSSEFPVKRSWGVEILDHRPDAVRLERLNSRAPLLLYHDRTKQVGVIESAEITGRRGKAVVRFSRSAEAEEIFQDVVEGIRSTVSVGYFIHRVVLESEDAEGLPVYRIVAWEPFEVSLEPTPADFQVGVGRNAEDGEKILLPEMERRIMPEPVKEPVVEPKAPEVRTVDLSAERDKLIKDELKRQDEIRSVASKFSDREDVQTMARKALAENQSVAEFQGEVLARVSNAKPITSSASEIGMTDAEARKFSIVRAINAVLSNDWRGAEFEREASEAVGKRVGKNAQGFFVPTEVLTRDLTKAGDGAALVGTNLLTGSFIDMLRNFMVLKGLGATMLDGLVGNVAIPRQTGGATAYWVGEGGAPTESNAVFDQVPMSAKTVGAVTDITRSLLKQSTPSVESLIQKDLAQQLALEIDRVGIAGLGSSNQPRGILYQSGIGAVVGGATGLAPAWSHIVELETKVAVGNADIGSLAYLTNAKVRGKLKQTEKASTTGQFIWENKTAGEGMLNGYKAIASNQVPSNLDKSTSVGVCSAIIFGNFADLVIGLWGGLDITVDPYSGSTSGSLRIVALQDIDVAVRHAASFAAMQDALTA